MPKYTTIVECSIEKGGRKYAGQHILVGSGVEPDKEIDL